MGRDQKRLGEPLDCEGGFILMKETAKAGKASVGQASEKVPPRPMGVLEAKSPSRSPASPRDGPALTALVHFITSQEKPGESMARPAGFQGTPAGAACHLHTCCLQLEI